MTDTTTIVVAVGLVAGAIFLATRKEESDDGSADDGAGSGLCGNVATLDKSAGAACNILNTLKNLLPESECSRNGGRWGAYTSRDGFTGSCHRYGGGIYPSKTGVGGSPALICCGRKDKPYDPRCSDVRAGTPRSCVDGFARDPASIRDHRTLTK